MDRFPECGRSAQPSHVRLAATTRAVVCGAQAAVMLRDIEACKAAGVNAVVLGCLTPAGEVDEPLLRRLVSAARPLRCVAVPLLR